MKKVNAKRINCILDTLKLMMIVKLSSMEKEKGPEREKGEKKSIFIAIDITRSDEWELLLKLKQAIEMNISPFEHIYTRR